MSTTARTPPAVAARRQTRPLHVDVPQGVTEDDRFAFATGMGAAFCDVRRGW